MDQVLNMTVEAGEMSTESASQLVDSIFKTLHTHDADRKSAKSVDDVVSKALSTSSTFMKVFAAALVQVMERQLKFQSLINCLRLLKWSCLLLSKTQFASVSRNAFCRLASAQSSVLHFVDSAQGSLRLKKACRHTLFHLFSEVPEIYKTYMEELKDGRVPYKDSPELLGCLIEFSSLNSTSLEEWKPVFLDIYVKAVLNTREKPGNGLSVVFCPLFSHLLHDDFSGFVVPSAVKMLKRNPELVLESVGVLLKSVNLDLSKYAIEILSVVLPQARHADEGRRLAAFAIVGCLSEKSSNPDVIDAMFNAVKSVIGGSEGRLAFPYQRVGMINVLQELSRAPEGKYLSSLAPIICGFLLSCYKDDGNEEVKLACLPAVSSWAASSADAIQADIINFIASGLKEKEVLRRAHLRCLRLMCKNADAVVQMSSLLVPLVQLVKTGFTKATQRLDGIYALFSVGKIVAVDVKADEIVSKEKLWSLISQNEPSVVPISMASKLSIEDCMTCVDLVEVLLVDHSHRVLETFPVKSLLQFIIFLLCYPSWDVRRAMYDSTKKILAAAPQLSEALLLEFSNYLSVLGEKVHLLKTSDAENSLDAQVPFLPSVEVLVKALVVISPALLAAAPSACMLLFSSSHHPFLVGTAKKNAVWRRVQKCLQTHGFDAIDLITDGVSNLCKDLLGPAGLISDNPLDQETAIYSLSTLMCITPKDTYLEFEKHLKNLPERYAHDALTEKDIQLRKRQFVKRENVGLGAHSTIKAADEMMYTIKRKSSTIKRHTPGSLNQVTLSPMRPVIITLRYEHHSKIFHTPEGMLLNEQGVYVAESIAAKNTKQAKGRFRVYENNDGMDDANSNQPARREPPSKENASVGKKDSGKSTKKSGMPLLQSGKTAKEEARELQLREEACVRDRIFVIQKQLSLMLRALGEMAIANPVFTHSQLPSLVKFVNPLLRSPIVGDVAFETIVNLSKCTADPLCNWALDIATALRLIVTEEVNVLLELIPSGGEVEANGRPSFGLFERVINGLSVSCKSGALPVDSFTFVFPVLYHALGVVPAYQASIGPALNELCLGLQPVEVAHALYGVYAKDVHVRTACLNAIKCIPSVASRSLPQNVEVATSIWIALHDPEKA
ncbi:unnamed protein product [Ilex paraguariensis]|uniref:Stalled ribosome sensor GCN1-like N-terminal domain-containing protein n=1 Tax=Ilex paraguariensis TaxID=185542 RepID=A0ABC8T8A8_9AQUA